MSAIKQIYYGVSCQPTDLDFAGELVAHFSFYPVWVLLFNSILSLVDSDFYFFLASNFLLTAVCGYAKIVSNRLGIARPAAYDHELCCTTEFAFPDPTFVATMAYTVVVIAGLYADHRTRNKLSVFRVVTLSGVVLLYCASTLLTNYFSVWQFAANLVLAVLISLLFIFVYRFTAAHLWLDAGDDTRRTMQRLGNLSGCSGQLFGTKKQSPTQTHK